VENPFVIKSEISSEMDLGTESGCVPELQGRLKHSNGAVTAGTSMGSGARSTSSIFVAAVAIDAAAVAIDASVAGRGAAAGPPAPSPGLLELLGSPTTSLSVVLILFLFVSQ
jgi:hypothetical protein